MGETNKAKKLRELLSRGKILQSVGCHDCVSAKIVEQSGHECAYITGHGLSVTLTGYSDYGLTTMTEVMTAAKNITNAINIPAIIDADTGYGNPLNVIRTIREAEIAGVAGIQLEDQKWPKKCGHMEGKKLITAEEMLNKIKAAADSRKTDLVIIARTDARAIISIDEAIERSNKFLEAGADVAFIDAAESKEDMIRACNEINGFVLTNMTEGGKTPILTAKELEDIGFNIVIYPLSLMYTATKAMFELAKAIREKGTSYDFIEDKMVSFHAYNKFIGLEELIRLENKYS